MTPISHADIPLFRRLDRLELAKLVPSLVLVRLQPGETLFRQGDRGDSLYTIVEGQVRVWVEQEDGTPRELRNLGEGEFFGEVALFTGEPRSANVSAATPATLLRLSKARFDELVAKHPSLGRHLAEVLSQRLSSATGPVREETPEVPAVPDTVGPAPLPFRPAAQRRRLLWTAGAAAIWAATAGWLALSGVKPSHGALLDLTLAATLLWGLDLFSYHAVAVALPVAAVLLGVADPRDAFSGFSSPSWFLVLGVFAVAAAASRTGLLYRLTLMVLRRFPPSYLGQTAALAVAGLAVTPVIPSSNGRATLAGPIVLTLSDVFRFRRGSRGAVGLSMAALLGFGHLSFLFMNGTATCYLALGLLPVEAAKRITWAGWLAAALPLGLSFFALSLGAILLLYRPKRGNRPDLGLIDAQLRALGPFTPKEWVSLAVINVSIAGFATEPLHHVQGAWIAMAGFLVLVFCDVLDEKAIRTDIDWNFLLSFGALVGFGKVISGSGLAALLAQTLSSCFWVFCGSQTLFLLAVSLFVTCLRFVLPLPAALLVSLLGIVPVASTAGIDPFAVALVALISCNPWLLPYQNNLYLNLFEATEKRLFLHGHTLRLARVHVLAVLVAVAVSVPYWRHLGMLR